MSVLDKFTVIDLIKTRSASVCTIAGTMVKFNNQTAQELRYPEYVQFLIDAKGKQVAIRVCKEDAPNAVKFSKPEGEQKAQIKITLPTVVDMLRKLMNWDASENWNLPGVYFAEDQALVYSLEAAYAPKPKGGWAVKREREAALEAAMESMSGDATEEVEE